MGLRNSQTESPPVRARKSPYRESFDEMAARRSSEPPWLARLRESAMMEFDAAGFPTVHEEAWRFTNLAPLTRLPFRPAAPFSGNGLFLEALERFPLSQLQSSRLVFINGYYSSHLSKVPPGLALQIRPLSALLETDGGLLEKHLGEYIDHQGNPLAALNTAFFEDGAAVLVPPEAVLIDPVHLIFITTAGEIGTAVHPRNLVLAGAGSSCTIIESYLSTATHPALTNSVTELIVGKGAVVEHCKFQDESRQGFHIGSLHARLGRNCRFTSHSIATGSRLARNQIYSHLAEEGVHCVLNGLYLTQGEQLIDHYMIVEHAKPHCESHEYFNGILDDRSRGVFHGRILVRPDAQKTDAKQTNKNLLLSDEATIDTKPQLEIYADDVKCTHGATVGQLDSEAIFYLRSRGIGQETARRMLMHAFAGEIIDRIQCVPLREELDRLIWERLEERPRIAVAS